MEKLFRICLFVILIVATVIFTVVSTYVITTKDKTPVELVKVAQFDNYKEFKDDVYLKASHGWKVKCFTHALVGSTYHQYTVIYEK